MVDTVLDADLAVEEAVVEKTADQTVDKTASEKLFDKDNPADEPKDGEGDKKADEKKEEKKDGPPEAYEAFKLPEGVEVDTVKLEAAQPLFKELGLDQAGAQKLVDFYVNTVKGMSEAQQTAWQAANDKWVADVRADKEIGGDKFDESLGMAKKAIKQFGTPELQAAMKATGAGNHPEFIRAWARVGRAISEDKFVTGEANVGKRSAAEIMFGGTSK
jgi:hypothetical protein